jgi:hypothetical protein
MADLMTPQKRAASMISKRSGFLPYSRYDKTTGVLTDPPGTTVFGAGGPVRRTLQRVVDGITPPSPGPGVNRPKSRASLMR